MNLPLRTLAYLREFGPPIPQNMSRPAAFHISRWSLVPELNGNGEVCLTFAGHAIGYDVDVVLLLACSPKTGDPLRCMIIRIEGDSMEHETLELEWLPGVVEDIARTAVLDCFVGRSKTYQWPTHPQTR